MPGNQPTIQFWDLNDAPAHIIENLPRAEAFDWIAVIPLELQSSEVLSLIVSGPGVETVYRCTLTSGEWLLAGATASTFDITSVVTAGYSESGSQSKSRSATASGASPESGSQQ